jgi:hypothetical protein
MYARLACLCVDSLIRRGGVDPCHIIISIDHTLDATIYSKFIRNLGVNVRVIDTKEFETSKIYYISRLFLEYPVIEKIIQLDADTVLTERMDLLKVIEDMSDDGDVYMYPQLLNGFDVFKMRLVLTPNGHDYCLMLTGAENFRTVIKRIFNCNVDEFTKWLSDAPWIYGGLTIYNRTIMLNSEMWDKIQQFSYECVCDEICLLLCMYMYKSEFKYKFMAQELLPHRVSPPIMDIVDGRGIIHLAGDWYRLHNQAHKFILDTAVDNLIKNSGIIL